MLGVRGVGVYVWFAFAGAIAALALVYAIASLGREGATPVKLALAGAAVTAMLASVTSGIVMTNVDALNELRFWQVGSLAGRYTPDGAEAIDLAREQRPDLAVLDIAMPRLTGLQAARELSRSLPELRILILTMYDNEQYFFEALKVGASGYVLKSVADRDLVAACRAAMRDEPFFYPGAVNTLRANLLQKLGLRDRLELTRYAIRVGLIEP